jgi:hypothetical protein
MFDLPGNSFALLLRLVAADHETRPTREPFLVVVAGDGVTILHDGLGDDLVAPGGITAIEDLEEAGYLRLAQTTKEALSFQITDEGFAYVKRLEQAAARIPAYEEPPPVGHALDWTARVMPVLAAIGSSYHRAPNELGITPEILNEELGRDTPDDETSRILYALLEAGYIEATVDIDRTMTPLIFG